MVSHSRHVDILDTTLRDGSYTIGYQFTADETALIAQGLERAGVNYIEVGHGLGLGAARSGKGAQAASDAVYMRACAKSLCKSRFGFFYIPGIGDVTDLGLLADEGGTFVRVGVTLESLDAACDAIEAAGRLGLEVWANVMKTYAYPVKDCSEAAVRLAESGARGIYIVDSAGGMLPAEVASYARGITRAIKEKGKQARVGFHGHDNLSLGTACSLAAVEAGCDIVDGALLGIGRSIGNAATEVLAMVLERAGYQTGINPWYAADLAEKTIRPFLQQRWRHSSLEQALGYAQIHSGFLPLLEKASEESGIGVRDIVLSLSSEARLNITEADANSAAAAARGKANAAHGKEFPDRLDIQERIISPELAKPHDSDIAGYATEIRSQSLRMARPAAIVVAGPWRPDMHKQIRLQQIRLMDQAVVGAIEVGNATDLERVVAEIDGKIDMIFLDKAPHVVDRRDLIEKLELRQWKSGMLPYSDEIAGLIGACHMVAIAASQIGAKEAEVMGCDERAHMVRSLLPYWGIGVSEPGASSILVIASKTENCEPKLHVGLKLIYDLMSGVLNAENARKFIENGVEVVRLDVRAALAGEVIGLLEARKLTSQVMGRGEICEVPVVAGGAWGNEGDVVVDSIERPTHVLGIADGNGGLKTQLGESDKHTLERVKRVLRDSVLDGLGEWEVERQVQ